MSIITYKNVRIISNNETHGDNKYTDRETGSTDWIKIYIA